MDVHSELYESEPEYVLIQMCTEKLYEKFCATPLSERGTFTQNIVEQIRYYWELIGKHSKARILQFDFVEVDDKVFGTIANKVGVSFLYQLRRLNLALMDVAAENKNVFLVNLSTVQNRMDAKVL